MIVPIIFVKAVGFGPLAGILILVVYSIGFVAKMLAERTEEIDHGQVEALETTGASRFKVILYAIAPQVVPTFWPSASFAGTSTSASRRCSAW